MAETARISLPTVIEAALGRLSVAACDQRLADWARRLCDQAAIELEVRGAEEVDWRRAYVVMSNHQSHYDIPILYRVLRGTVRMVTKQELFRVPVWGRAMRDAGFVSIDRKNRASAIESIREAAAAVERGVSIWIAPEGTRSRSGELGTFKKGGFIMARDLGAPILPVCISGSRKVLPPDTLAVVRGQHVRVSFGAVISTADQTTEQLMDQVRAFFQANL